MTESCSLRMSRVKNCFGRIAVFVFCCVILSPHVAAQFRLREPSVETPTTEAPSKAAPKLTSPIVRKPATPKNADKVREPDQRETDEDEMPPIVSGSQGNSADSGSEIGELTGMRKGSNGDLGRSTVRDSAVAASEGTTFLEATPVALIDADPDPEEFFTGPVPRTRAILEDVALRDVSLIGNFACAVGDRGVICVSYDAGRTWSTKAVELDSQLMSVCFLTDRVGWIGGWIQGSPNAEPQSVILETRDGGETWRRLLGPRVTPGSSTLTATSLPGLIHLEYFGLDEAIAVTTASERHGKNRIFQSQNGGLTWTAVTADDASEEWLGADFVSLSEGIVGGDRECYAAVVASQAVVINTPQMTLRGMRGASLDSSGAGWLVGDGGSIVLTENAGVTWRTPDGDRPEGFSQLVDLRTVAHQEAVVLAAGAPGSCILRSDDAGKSWSLIPTNVAGLLHRIRLHPQGLALAVGTFGQILRSTDAGITWEVVRSGQHRSGLLNLTGNSADVSWNLLARVAAEDGVRSAVAQMSQPLDASDSSVRMRWQTRNNSTIASLGICDGTADWMFARTRPEAHRSVTSLVSEWDRQTDGHLRELLPLRLARQLRMWQPAVVVIEPCPLQGTDQDAVASIFRDALPRAIEIAADEQNSPLADMYLPAWTVSRVVMRTPANARSELAFSELDLLPRLRTTTGLLADFAHGLAVDDQKLDASASNECHYTIVFDQNELTSARHLFDGITNELDASCRRAIPSLDRDASKRLQQVVTSAKIEASSLTGNMQMVGGDGTQIAHLESVGDNLPATLALRQLRELGDANLSRNNMEGFLSVQQEMIRRFPNHPEAQTAAELLLLFYSSAETRRYRMQGQMSASITGSSRPGEAPATPQMTGPFQSNAANHLDALQQRWDENAATAFQILSRPSAPGSNHSALVTTVSQPRPEILLRQAANYRDQSLSSEHSTMLSEVSRMSEPFATFARVEMQITHGASVPEIPVFNVPRRKETPFLDGILTDAMWEAADEIRLRDVAQSRRNAADDSQLSSLVMLGSDEEHLFVAGVFALSEQDRRRITLATHRSHDSDHGEKDRFELEIDTDRDYSTSFQFTIDESGLTSDRCWMLDRWDPTWYVDVKRDHRSWRFEAAIPLRELATQQPRLGTVWGIRLRRIQPGQHRHELTPTQGPATNGTGLIRFIRPRAKTPATP